MGVNTLAAVITIMFLLNKDNNKFMTMKEILLQITKTDWKVKLIWEIKIVIWITNIKWMQIRIRNQNHKNHL